MKHCVHLFRRGKPLTQAIQRIETMSKAHPPNGTAGDPLRARRIGPSAVSLTGAFVSVKDQLHKAFESPLERDFLAILDFDWKVSAFYDQPVRVNYTDAAGVPRHYTPDVLVYWRRDLKPARWMRPLLAEIKTKRDLAGAAGKYDERFAAAEAYAKSRGWEFRVLTEQHIRTPYLQNARFLRRYREESHNFLDCGLLERALGVFETEAAPAGELIEEAARMRAADPDYFIPVPVDDLEAKARLLNSLWYMVATGLLGADLVDEPLTMASMIWPKDWQSSVTPPYHSSVAAGETGGDDRSDGVAHLEPEAPTP